MTQKNSKRKTKFEFKGIVYPPQKNNSIRIVAVGENISQMVEKMSQERENISFAICEEEKKTQKQKITTIRLGNYKKDTEDFLSGKTKIVAVIHEREKENVAQKIIESAQKMECSTLKICFDENAKKQKGMWVENPEEIENFIQKLSSMNNQQIMGLRNMLRDDGKLIFERIEQEKADVEDIIKKIKETKIEAKAKKKTEAFVFIYKNDIRWGEYGKICNCIFEKTMDRESIPFYIYEGKSTYKDKIVVEIMMMADKIEN